MAIENGPKTADVDYYLPLLEPALELTGRLRDIHDVRSSVAEDDWSALQLAKVLTGRLDLPHLLGVNPLACVRIIRLADRMGVSVEVFAPELDSLDLVMGRVDLATISDQSIVREVVEVARDYRLLDWSAHVGVPSLLLAPAPIIAALPPRDVAFLLSASVAELGWYASAHALFKRWARARGLGSLAKAGPEESAAWLCDQFMVEGLADNSWAGLGEYFGLVRRDDR
jgi:hypothetical protein